MSIYSVQLKRLYIEGERYAPEILRRNKPIAVAVAVAVILSLGILYLKKGSTPSKPPSSQKGKMQASPTFSATPLNSEKNSTLNTPQAARRTSDASRSAELFSPPSLLRHASSTSSASRILSSPDASLPQINWVVSGDSPRDANFYSAPAPLVGRDFDLNNSSIELDHTAALEMFDEGNFFEAIDKLEAIASKPWESIPVEERNLYISSLYMLADNYYKDDDLRDVERSIGFYNRISSIEKEMVPRESTAIYIKALSCSIADFFKEQNQIDTAIARGYFDKLCSFEKSEIPPVVVGAYLISLSYARLLLPEEAGIDDKELIDFLVACLRKVSMYKLEEVEAHYQGVFIRARSVYVSLISSDLKDSETVKESLEIFESLLKIDKGRIVYRDCVEPYILALSTFADNIFSWEKAPENLLKVAFEIYKKIATFDAGEIPDNILDCYYKSLLYLSMTSLQGRGCTANVKRAEYYLTALRDLDMALYSPPESDVQRAIESCVLQANMYLRSLESTKDELSDTYPLSPL